MARTVVSLRFEDSGITEKVYVDGRLVFHSIPRKSRKKKKKLGFGRYPDASL